MLRELERPDAEAIISLADCRIEARLGEDETWFGPILESARDRAIAWCEVFTGLSLQLRSFKWSTDGLSGRLRLPIGPIGQVTEVRFTDRIGQVRVVAPEAWYAIGDRIAFAPASPWPCPVTVEFRAGFETGGIPQALLGALKTAVVIMVDNPSEPDMTPAEKQAAPFSMRTGT